MKYILMFLLLCSISATATKEARKKRAASYTKRNEGNGRGI
jgi:hypothetical protein